MKNFYTHLHLIDTTNFFGGVYTLPASLPPRVSGASFRLGWEELELPVGSDRARRGSPTASAEGAIGGSNGARTALSTTSLECLRKAFVNPILAEIPTPNVFKSELMRARYGLSPVSNGAPRAPYGISPTFYFDTGRKTSTKSSCPSKNHPIEGRFGPIRLVYSAVFSDTRKAAGESPATRFSNTAIYVVRPTETLVSMSLPTQCFPFSRVSQFALAPLGGTAVARERGAASRVAAPSRAQVAAQAECVGTLGKLFRNFSKYFILLRSENRSRFPARGTCSGASTRDRERNRRPLRARALGYRTRPEIHPQANEPQSPFPCECVSTIRNPPLFGC